MSTLRAALAAMIVALVLIASGCSSSTPTPAAYTVAQLQHRLVTADQLGLSTKARLAPGVTKSSTTIATESITGSGGLFLFVSLVAGPDAKATSRAFVAFAASADNFFLPGVKRDGLSLGDAGFSLDGSAVITKRPQLQYVFVRGAIQVQVTATITSTKPTPLTTAQRALTLKLAQLQDAALT